MTIDQQVNHYKTFGFVVFRNLFSEDEVRTLRKEFDLRVCPDLS